MNKYMDFSLSRTAPLLGFTAAVALLVVLTFTFKQTTYGATPFFRSAYLFGEGIVLSAYVALRHLGSGQFASALLAAEQQTIASTSPARSIPVLTYHRINLYEDGSANVPFDHFHDQMEKLHSAGWRTITLEAYQAWMRGEIELPERSFLITFDDGAQQSYYPTDPIFRTLGFNAVQYPIVAGTQVYRSTYYMSPEQLHSMLATGRWEIGSHSFDAHRPMPTRPGDKPGAFYTDLLWIEEEGRLETEEEFRMRVREDLLSSKEYLEREYGVVISSFAIPFGGEAGFENAANFPEGEAITIEEAGKLYETVWVQTEHKEFTQNFPQFPVLGPPFLQQRIHVDHDWDGKRLLAIMENGLPKSLPFTDDMSFDRGWLESWGNVQAGGILLLSATEDESSSQALLDGSRLWRTYDFRAATDWNGGAAFLLGNATDAKTYRACAYTDGRVQVLDIVDGERRVLAGRDSGRIDYGNGVELGMQISQNSITCLYQGEPIVSAHIAARQGGIGLQVWDETLGTASLTVTRVNVEEI